MCQCFYDIYVATVPDELLTWRPKNDGTPSISNMSLASSYSSIHSEAIQQSTIPTATTPDHNTTDTPVGTVTDDIQSKDVPPSENGKILVAIYMYHSDISFLSYILWLTFKCCSYSVPIFISVLLLFANVVIIIIIPRPRIACGRDTVVVVLVVS